MPSTYTVNLGIEKPATGEQSGTWGDTTNVNFDIIDQAVNGSERVTLTSAGTSGSPNDLNIVNGSTTSSEGRNKWIEIYSASDLGGSAYVRLVPNDAEKILFIRNSLAGSQSVLLFQGTYNASNDLEIPAGVDMVVKFDGAGASATVTDVFTKLRATEITTPTLTAGTADINGGSVDGATVGAASASTGAFTTLTASTSLNIASSTTVDGVLDEDNMASDSATKLATQQSIKAYVDSQVGTVDTLAEILANGNTSGSNNLIIDNGQALTSNTINETTAGSGVTIDSVLLKDDVVNATDIETGSISANDGTAAATIANSTGNFTITNFISNSVDIGGGAIDGTNIGASSAATGAFTTFTSNGIDDNATTTAITIDANENTFFSSANTHAASVNVASFANTTTGEPVAIALGAVADNGGLGNEGGIYFDAGADGSAANNQLQFNADHQSTVTPDMVITGAGNVGINTTNPNLHGWTVAVTLDTASNAGYELGQSGTKYGAFALQGDGRVQLTNFTANPLTFQTNNTERMRIDDSGRLLIGTSSTRETSGGSRQLQVEGTSGVTSSQSIVRNQNSASGPSLTLGKSRSASVGGSTAVVDGDTLGQLTFAGADGTDLNTVGASIKSNVDGTPASNNMPANLIFSVNSGSASESEAMRISANGQVKIGGTTNSPANVPAVLFGTGNASTVYNTGHTGLHINNENATGGSGNFGAGLSFGRFGSSSDDQSAAIVPVQTTSDEDQMGIAFFTHNTNTRANPLLEAMRILGSGNVGIDTTAPTYKFVVSNNGEEGLEIDPVNDDQTIRSFYYDRNTSAYIINKSFADQHVWTAGGSSEAMRLNASGNLGIGTSTPVGKLELNNGSSAVELQFKETSTAYHRMGIKKLGSQLQLGEYNNDGDTITSILCVEGNGDKVGIGTTSPDQTLHVHKGSAGTIASHSSSVLTLENSTTAILQFLTPNTNVQQIRFGDPQDDGAGIIQYDHSASTLQFNVNGPERMRIDSSGNVGIGTSTVNAELHILNTTPVVLLQSSGAGTDNTLSFLSRNISNVAAYADIIGVGSGHNSTNAPIVFTQGSGQTERIRIDSAGRFVIQGGVSHTANAPTYRGNLIIANAASNTTTEGGLEFMTNSGGGAGYGGRVSGDSSGNIRFETRSNSSSWTQQAAVLASGQFVAGTTAAINQAHTFTKNVVNNVVVMNNENASTPYGLQVRYGNADPNGVGSPFVETYGHNGSSFVNRHSLRSNGGIANYQANDVNLSDERLKKDIAPLGSMWDKFKAIEIVTFKYKDQTHDDDNIGVIAQQVESVAPEFVDNNGFGEPPAGEDPYKTIFTADLYHATIKALQEAMARIETLEAEVATLKGE